MKSVSMAIVLFLAPQVFAETRTNRIFEVGKTEGPALFTQSTEIDTKENGDRSWVSKIKDASGNVVMTEIAFMKDDKIQSQYVEQLQVGKSFELKTADGQATFLTYDISNGQKKQIESATTPIDEAFVTGPAIEFYLKNRWDRLMKAEKLEVSFGVFELSRKVGFHFKRTSKPKDDVQKTFVEVEMKPSSFFVSILVDPLKIEIDTTTKRMVRFIGRTPLRVKVGDKLKPIDAEILYP